MGGPMEPAGFLRERMPSNPDPEGDCVSIGPPGVVNRQRIA